MIKRKKVFNSLIDYNKKYSFEECIMLLKKFWNKKFDESIEVSINFNIIPKKNIMIKGCVCFDHSIGKKYKIAVFDNNIHDIKEKDIVYLNDENIKTINKKNINFNILITSPNNMIKLAKYNKLLNSKKLMPDIKYDTITNDIETTVKNINSNYVKFKIDKFPYLNFIIGKISLSDHMLKSNLEKLIIEVKKNKFKNYKSINIKNIIISSTMSPGIKLDIDSINY